MAGNEPSKVCEAEGNVCKRDVQGLCYHCSKNLCRVHFMQHAQLVEDKTRAELQSLTDQFNELSLRFNQLSVSDEILQKPLAQLEKWRTKAYAKIDEIVENKRRELHYELDKYRRSFLDNKEEQLSKLNTTKKTLAELIKESDASAKQIADLQGSVGEIEAYLNALNAPVFYVMARPWNWSVDICTTYPDAQVTSVKEVREFKITYVRRNGMIGDYYVRTKSNGEMDDLIKSFIRQYTAVEVIIQNVTNDIYSSDDLPKLDFILPVEVYNHRIHLQYNGKSKLNGILERDRIVFYETLHSVNAANHPHILMPCLFRNNQTKQDFGLPIYVNVPRTGCRGVDVRDALHDTLENFYKPNSSVEQPSCDAYLQSQLNYVQRTVKLDDALEDELVFNKGSTTLFVEFDSQHFDTDEWDYFRQLRFP